MERILIVGGGIGGLSLAIALRSRGIKPTIIECADRWPVSGTGLYLIGAATRALADLGVGDAVVLDGATIHAQVIRSARGARLARIDLDAFWAACGPCVGIARPSLHRVLANRVRDVPTRFGATIVALRQEYGGVEVRFSDDTTAQYDLVVGADGIRSSIRAQIPGAPAPRFRGQMGWRFVTRQAPAITDWTVFLAADRAFLAIPIGDDAMYCYADRATAAPIDDPVAGRLDRLRELFRDFATPVRDVLDAVPSGTEIHAVPIEELAASVWGDGRVVLIGDAAHAMSPNMACGAAMAIEDALVLAELIAAGGRRNDLVASFARRRSPRVEWVRQQTDHRDRMRSRGLPLPLRDLLLRLSAPRAYRTHYRPLLARP